MDFTGILSTSGELRFTIKGEQLESSFLARTIAKSAIPPSATGIFSPETLPLEKFVWRLSNDESVGVSSEAKQPMSSPDASLGRKEHLCSSDPYKIKASVAK